MPHTIVCTICSRQKDTRPEPLPAIERYQSERIKYVAALAEKQNLPFYILSGKFALISAKQWLMWYDHVLLLGDAIAFAERLARQLEMLHIEEIHFYTKNNSASAYPYRCAMLSAAARAGVTIVVHELYGF